MSKDLGERPPLEKILSYVWQATVKAHVEIKWYLNDLERILLEQGMSPGIIGFRRQDNTSRILDVSAGYGFPAREMRWRGWDVVLNEPSQAMRDLADIKTSILGVVMGDVATLHYETALHWQEFKKRCQAEAYDAAWCLGNSLPYASGWGNEVLDVEHTQKEILKVLLSFREVLKRGGLLVVTKHKDDFPDGEGRFAQSIIGNTVVNPRIYKFKTELYNEPATRIRHWKREACAENLDPETVHKHDVQSYALRDEELQSVLEQVDFRDVQRRDIHGDNPGYTTFIARKG